MKNQNTNLLALVVASATILSACNPLSKMIKRQNEVNFALTPNPVEMHADEIAISLSGSFPTKYFNKKVSAEITPVIKYANGEESFAPLKLKGETSEEEGTVINFEKGGSFSHTAKIPYKDGMEVATVELRIAGKYKTQSKNLDPRKVADGTIITPKLVMASEKAILGKDNFKKFELVDNKVVINYLVNNSTVRGTEMTDKDVKELVANLKTWSKNPKMQVNGVVVDAYASPEGEISKNDNLANERAASADKAMAAEFKKAKLAIAEGSKLTGKGEDWDGFKKLMVASDIKDKELIIRVLESYSDLTKRESEIKNLAATYNEVAKKVLPELRRSEVNVVMKKNNLTDDEIKTLVDSKIDSLDAEQMMYAATLYTDDAKKEMIYKSFSNKFAQDWRGPNNLGYLYVAQNKIADAKAQFEKADGLSANNTIVKNNLGVCERLNGNVDAAMELYKSAAGAGSEVNENMGIIYIMKGDYASAKTSYSGVNSFNAALANLLSGNNSIGGIIDGSTDKDEALAYYLKAVAGARANDKNALVNNLKTATGKDAGLKAKAKNDAEFIKFKDDAEFQSAVN